MGIRIQLEYSFARPKKIKPVKIKPTRARDRLQTVHWFVLHHPVFQTKPTLAQFAKNGSWETAWAFTLETLPSENSITAFLESNQELAFEVFFGQAFLGVRFEGKTDQVKSFAIACVQAFLLARDARTFFESLCEQTGLTNFTQSFSFAEIGAINAWRSVGAFKINDLLEPDLEAIWQALQTSSVTANTTHVKAIEFACNQPIAHWLALPVSLLEPPFELQENLIRQALEFVRR
jgi:hypothetical protein